MAVSAARTITITFSGDVSGAESISAATNSSSPGSIQYINLASGFNGINVPTSAVAATIVPPAGNATSITLKGVTGDSGIRLHNTDPTTIALHSSVSSIGLTAGDAITGVRIFWS
jgi:hypothetical protein